MKPKNLLEVIAFSLGASLLGSCSLINNYIDKRINERLIHEYMPRTQYAIPDGYTYGYLKPREHLQKEIQKQKKERDDLIEIFQRTTPKYDESTTFSFILE